MQSVHRNTASSLPPGQVQGHNGLFAGFPGRPEFSLSCIESVSRREWQVS